MLSTQVTSVRNVVFKFSHPIVSINTAAQNLALGPLKTVVVFTTSVSVRKGRGQHAVIKLLVQVQGMTNGPIRSKQVNR